jgi:predicted PurR-regulated permease PerM
MSTTLAFAFGCILMIIVIIIVVIVIGMLKVIKHDRQFRTVHEDISLIHRHFTDVERNIHQEIYEINRKFDQHTDNLRRELQAYTDSRIDKTLGTTKKQILKD